RVTREQVSACLAGTQLPAIHVARRRRPATRSANDRFAPGGPAERLSRLVLTRVRGNKEAATVAEYGASNGAFANREQRDGSVLPPVAGNLRGLCPGGRLRLGKAALSSRRACLR